MNELEYDYIPLNLPNVLAEVNKDREEPEGGAVYFINEYMAPLILELAKKQPHWQFISTDYTIAANARRFTRFTVYHNRKSLGSLGMDYRGNIGNVFSIKNTRISKDMLRSQARTTKDLGKAIKIVLKNFRLDTSVEALDTTLEYVREQLTNQYHRANKQFDELYRMMFWKMQPKVMANWQETYRSLALKSGVDSNTIESLEEALHRKKQTSEVRQCEAVNGGAVVLIRGNEYLVSDGLQSTSRMQLHTTDTLPAGLKRAVGLLKLAPENKIISGVGVKMRENVFYVIATEKTDE